MVPYESKFEVVAEKGDTQERGGNGAEPKANLSQSQHQKDVTGGRVCLV